MLRVSDAPELHAAIVESTDHLRPWMPWIAAEPLTVEDREILISSVFAKGWESESDFAYGMFMRGQLVGGCGLHRLDVEDGLEIGYWVRVGRTGRGLATVATQMLCHAAFQMDGIAWVEIHHDRANIASGRIPAKLGFALVREVDDEITAPGEIGMSVQWRLERPIP
jgi:RimJ/RimL family protein N-acetyltransferase